MLLAKQAKAAGMVDSIATLDATIARVFNAVGGGQTTASRGSRMLRAESALPRLMSSEDIEDMPQINATLTHLSADTSATINVGGTTPGTVWISPPTQTFSERLAALADEAAEMAEIAQERARLRDKEQRPRFSTVNETALRSIRSASEVILSLVDPDAGAEEEDVAPSNVEQAVAPPDAVEQVVDPPVAEAPIKAPVLVPFGKRFASEAAWVAYIHQEELA
jgi:hypothetical protein